MTPRPGTRWRCPRSGETHLVEAVTGGWVDMRFGPGPRVGGMTVEAWREVGFVPAPISD